MKRQRSEGGRHGKLSDPPVRGRLVVLALVSLMSFALIWLVPGDPAAAFLDASATPQQIAHAAQRARAGQPLPLQMLGWYGRILSGDLGQSILLNRSVTPP